VEYQSDALLLAIRGLLEYAGEAQGLTDRLGGKLRLGPFISGIEVTQAIQYYRANQHLTNANDRGPDNSIHLAANKRAWVRVYLDSGLSRLANNLTGELIVEHRQGYFLTEWGTVATLAPQAPGWATANPNSSYVTQRSTIANTLNFIVSAKLMTGMIRLTARVWRVGDATKTPVDTYQETVSAIMLQTLRLRGIFIAYDGPDPTTTPPQKNVKLPAPTVANLQSTASWALKTFPVESQGSFSSGGTMNWFQPLTGVATSPGGCSDEWFGLNYWVSQMKLHDGNRSDFIYYGLLPSAIPIQNVGGCESRGVSAGPDTRTVTMAHEVGHGAGLLHGPCNAGNVDPNYPAYEPYDPANTPRASLGEYGLDITNGTIHPPAEKDFMSYCVPPTWTNWISLYDYRQLCYNDKFNPRTVGTYRMEVPVLVDPYLWPWEYIPDPPEWEQPPGYKRMKAEKLIAIAGIAEAGRLDVRSVVRLEALRDSSNADETSFVSQLIGATGEVVASAPVMRFVSRGSGCGCSDRRHAEDEHHYIFQALIADVEPGSVLRIVDRSSDETTREAVWARRAPGRPPRIARFAVKITGESGVAKWEASGARGCELEFSLQFSKDRGRSWNGLTVGVRSETHRFALTDLPSGSLIFRLLAHDGFSTTTAISRAVTLPPRPPAVSILHPQEGHVLLAGLPLQLWGGVVTGDGTPVDPDACSWRLDGRQVARGADEFIVAPPAGRHRCSFRVNGPGGRAEASVVFRTVDPGGRGPEPRSPEPAPASPAAGRKQRRRRRKR